MDRLNRLRTWYAVAVPVCLLLAVPWNLMLANLHLGRNELVAKTGLSWSQAGQLTEFIAFLHVAGSLALIYMSWRYVRFFMATYRAGRFGMRAWSIPAFARSGTGQNALRAEAERLSDDDLLAAVHQPGHTETAKAECVSVLKSRGLSEQRIADWLPPAATITVPSAVATRQSSDRYLKRAHTFKVLSGTLIALAVLVLALAFMTIPTLGFRTYSRHGTELLLLFALALTLFFATLSVGSVLLRNRALRILLLRPFGERQMTNALKKVVVRELGSLAHVYTLSDKNYRPNFFLRFFDIAGELWRTLLGLLLKSSLRVASVKNESTFFLLASAISRKTKPSFRSLLTSGQAFNIRSTNAWWMRCIDLLMHSSDVIVMDISRVSSGSAWEIAQIGRRGLAENCIFVVQERYQAEGRSSIDGLLPAGAQPDLHVFRDTGEFLDPKAFTEAVEQALRTALAGRRLPARPVPDMVARAESWRSDTLPAPPENDAAAIHVPREFNQAETGRGVPKLAMVAGGAALTLVAAVAAYQFGQFANNRPAQTEAQRTADLAAKPQQQIAVVSPPVPRPAPDDVMITKGALPEIAIGRAGAPATIVQYTSLTCRPCANFHTSVLPQLKKKYIDTGKARLLVREFPLDTIAAAGSVLVRCVTSDRTLSFLTTLFANQSDWANPSGNVLAKLTSYAQKAGLSREAVEACLQSAKLLEDVEAVRIRANSNFGVTSVPSFFINGMRMQGATMADFDGALAPLTKR